MIDSASHLSEYDVQLYAADPNVHPDRAVVEEHLLRCESCRLQVDAEIIVGSVVADPHFWRFASERDGTSERLQQFRSAARRGAEEDTQARSFLSGIIGDPVTFTWANIVVRPTAHTAGVVRVLCSEANAMCERNPRYARVLADHAITISGLLPRDHYLGPDGLARLRGLAWKERGNAMRFLGDFAAAHDAFDRAAREYHALHDPTFEDAIVALGRAAVFRDQERYDEALQTLMTAVRIFEEFRDDLRWRHAMNLRGGLQFACRDYRGARDTWSALLAASDDGNEEAWAAWLLTNIGSAEIELGEDADASVHLAAAARLHADAGRKPAALRAEWGLARLCGPKPEGIRRLRALRESFDSLGLWQESLLVSLDLVDGLLVSGDVGEAIVLCGALVSTSESAGLHKTALRALGYLRERAHERVLDVRDVRHVRTFLQQATSKPGIIFQRPSADS
jgi:tetratricopeptide (TPR) repeat protein